MTNPIIRAAASSITRGIPIIMTMSRPVITSASGFGFRGMVGTIAAGQCAIDCINVETETVFKRAGATPLFSCRD